MSRDAIFATLESDAALLTCIAVAAALLLLRW